MEKTETEYGVVIQFLKWSDYALSFWEQKLVKRIQHQSVNKTPIILPVKQCQVFALFLIVRCFGKLKQRGYVISNTPAKSNEESEKRKKASPVQSMP